MKRLSLLPLLLIALLIAGCSGIGSDNVADIGSDVSISQDTYNRWVVTTTAQANPGSKPGLSEAPDYKGCVQQQKKTVSAKANLATLKQLCAAQERAIKQQVLRQLVTGGWIAAEAKQQGIEANSKTVDNALAEITRSYPKVEGGVNGDDLRSQAETAVLQQQLRQKASAKQKLKPTEAQLKAFYSKNSDLLADQPSRDVYLMLSSSRAKASAAAAALRSGTSWNTVFKKYNDSRLWNSTSALLVNVNPKSWLPELSKEIFSAPVGVVEGPTNIAPLKAWSVVEVKSSRGGKAAPAYAKARAQLEQAWLAKQASSAGESAITGLQKKWQPQTTCATGYKKWYPCKGTTKAAG